MCLATRPRRHRHRLFHTRLGSIPTHILLPSFQLSWESPAENHHGPSRSPCRPSQMAESTLVLPVERHDVQASLVLPSHENDVDNATRPHPAPSVGGAPPTSGRQSVRAIYSQQGLSAETVEVMLKARRDSTYNQYATYTTAWFHHCSSQNIDPIRPSIPEALNFLQTLRIQRNLGYNAVNTARSALASIIQTGSNCTFGQDPLVCIYMKGVYNTKPPMPRYVSTWNPDVLLALLKTWVPARTLDLKRLTFKVVGLILLVSGQRIQTLAALDVERDYWQSHHQTFRPRTPQTVSTRLQEPGDSP